MVAMGSASSEVVSEKLLESGANVESVDVMGNDAFMLASALGRPKTMQFWLERFKDYDLERQNTVLGATPLITAANLGPNKFKIVEKLCKEVHALTL